MLVRKDTPNVKYLKSFPSDHVIKFDTANNELLMVGPNAGSRGVGIWVKMKIPRQAPHTAITNILDVYKNQQQIMDGYKNSLYGTRGRKWISTKTEIPFMISESYELVCIRKLGDEPRIGFWGQSGYGKTTMKHVIEDRAFHNPHWNVKLALMNDSQKEFGSYCLPNDPMVEVLKRFNEKPMPLPIVPLTPNVDGVDEVMFEEYGIGFKMALPFDEVITNSHKYFEDLQGTGKYFTPLADKLLGCQTPEEVLEVFMNKGAPEIYQPPLGSIKKMRALLNQLYEREIIDRWCGVPSKWRVKHNGKVMEFNPVTACLMAGLVPVIETADILAKKEFPQLFQYYAMDIYNKQVTPHFVDNNITIWLDIEEILDITGKGKKQTMASEAVKLIQTKGRQRRIGTLIATQNYSHVPERIRTNCNYIMCFNTTREAKDICNDYGFKSPIKDRIKKLDKFECMAYSQDGFRVYGIDGNIDIKNGPIFGKALPPLSLHEKPNKPRVG